MRQYREVPPVLSTASAPRVQGTTGLGTGGGAYVQSKGAPSDGQGFGRVAIVAGVDASIGGSVTLVFDQTPPVLFFAATDGFGTLTAPNNDGAHTTITVNWTGRLGAGNHHGIDYEWSASF